MKTQQCIKICHYHNNIKLWFLCDGWVTPRNHSVRLLVGPRHEIRHKISTQNSAQNGHNRQCRHTVRCTRACFLENGLSPGLNPISRKKVSNFKPHYILPLPNGMVVHELMYCYNVGTFGPSLPQPPYLTSLRELQYTSARTNVMHAT